MTASYYFWKWADNDLPGKPAEVFAELMRGQLHPALQTFDARPLLAKLEEAAAKGRPLGETWTWQTNPKRTVRNACYVFVTCPRANQSPKTVRRFAKRFCPLGLSGYDEKGGHLLPCLAPKLNCFILGQFPNEPVYDIAPEELPALLRRIRPGLPEPWGELWDQRGAGAAIAEERRFRVEWREIPDAKRPWRFTQWRVRDARRLAALGGKDDTQALPVQADPDFLPYTTTLRIFQSFLRGDPRPPQYHWRKLRMKW